MKYEERVVAFIDVLGFKSLLGETVNSDGKDNEEAIDRIISAYNFIREIWDLDKPNNSSERKTSESKQVSIFSDCIVISFKAHDPSEVFWTLLEIKSLIMRLLWGGMLCRGAVSLGKFIHTPQYLFGPALVEAYLLESKAALYPRVILDRPIIEAGAKHHAIHHTSSMEEEYLVSLLEQDSDGMYFIDYFYKAQEELDDPTYDFPAYINNLKEIIGKGLMGSSHPSRADLRVKFSWMRERFNRMVETVHKSSFIEKLESSGEFELAMAYKKIKPISPRRDITIKTRRKPPS
jgi:hypothetical protein|tara:strand:+ start:6165 stop:7037 length:873 start_codon:yes stop_codon:yes gene_type:complete